jgi:hypothetical protein
MFLDFYEYVKFSEIPSLSHRFVISRNKIFNVNGNATEASARSVFICSEDQRRDMLVTEIEDVLHFPPSNCSVSIIPVYSCSEETSQKSRPVVKDEVNFTFYGRNIAPYSSEHTVEVAKSYRLHM